MTDDTISPLRQRMSEDMTVRGFTACTQRGYIAAVRRFTVFLGRSPDRATADRRLQSRHSGRAERLAADSWH
jgi:integrase/recombinase XerD